MNKNLIKLENVIAPMPIMHVKAAALFVKLRGIVKTGCGFDFLAKCGDAFRPADFHSGKDGVADRSWHKTGRAFDYDQTNPHLVVVSEPKNGKQYFRTYLKCTAQDGTSGEKKTVKDYRGNTVTAYLFDYSAAAEGVGFHRIPAWHGWEKNYNRREFWHNQFDEGLTWDQAMAQIS